MSHRLQVSHCPAFALALTLTPPPPPTPTPHPSPVTPHPSPHSTFPIFPHFPSSDASLNLEQVCWQFAEVALAKHHHSIFDDALFVDDELLALVTRVTLAVGWQ